MIMQLALFSSRIRERDIAATLLTEEKQLFIEMLETLNKFRKSILESVIEKKIPTVDKDEPKDIKKEENVAENDEETKMIRLLHPVPQFVANDLKVYGPFEEEDTTVLPKKAANVLIKKKRAEELKVEST